MVAHTILGIVAILNRQAHPSQQLNRFKDRDAVLPSTAQIVDFAAPGRAAHIPVKAILVPEMLKGYVFIEAEGPHFVEEAIAGVRHVRSRIPGLVSFSEIERYIIRKPVIEDLYEDDVVEITGGPFKGMRAKITRIDKSKGEVTLELLEATFTLPITVHSDYVKLVEKAKNRSE